jgi:cAMP-specific phosphodiesterase 4/high affinity cAMP-specific and IBMX-insensitive 3',5'-cyclic phosphodiesterase 8
MSIEFEHEKFRVQILENSIRREMTFEELNGLNALAIPTWVYNQQSASVAWSNTQAKNVYIRKSLDSRREATPDETLIGLYARVEQDECTVHIVGPKNILLNCLTSNNTDDIVTLIISPISVDSVKGSLIQQITLDESSFGKKIEVQSDDTPLDIITKMLDLIALGIPAPAIYAKALQSMLKDGTDINQPIILSNSYNIMFPHAAPQQIKLREILGQTQQSAPLPFKVINRVKRMDSSPCIFTTYPKSYEWHFDAFAYEPNEYMLADLCMQYVRETRMISVLGLDEAKMMAFLKKINQGYNTNLGYHNDRHASSVLHTTRKIMTTGGVAEALSSDAKSYNIILLVSFIAATIHDCYHHGVSNKYLIETFSHLAIVYNDQSPQENNHSSSAFQLLMQDEYNFMLSFSQDDMRIFRNLVISMILQTDMQHHFAFMTKMKARSSTAKPYYDDTPGIALVMQLVLKCSDLSHLTYPLDLHNKWVNCLQEEMFRQGDLEAAAGMCISPMCDRNEGGIMGSQVEFFDFVGIKMFKMMSTEFPKTEPLFEGLMSNYKHWLNQRR